MRRIYTQVPRAPLTWTGWSRYLVSVPWQEIQRWEKQHFENIIWSGWKMACWEQAGTLANVHIVTQVVSTPHRGTWYPATPGHAVRAQRGRGQTLGQVEIRPNQTTSRPCYGVRHLIRVIGRHCLEKTRSKTRGKATWPKKPWGLSKVWDHVKLPRRQREQGVIWPGTKLKTHSHVEQDERESDPGTKH